VGAHEIRAWLEGWARCSLFSWVEEYQLSGSLSKGRTNGGSKRYLITVLGSLAAAALTGFWAWLVSTIQVINALGWGIWLVLGLLLALLTLSAIAVAVWIADRLRPHRAAASSEGHVALVERGALPLAAAENDGVAGTYKEGAETDLMMFFLNYILPAGVAQKELQETMIRESCEDPVLQKFAIRGITSSDWPISEFWQSFSYLWGEFTSSPIGYVPLEGMMDRIAKIEKHYKAFVDQADEIAGGIDCRDHAALKQPWEEWRSKHNTLKAQYDTIIKTDPRFPKLFRPGRESRWGDIIPQAVESDGDP
jgi:hypothetical protein